MKRILIVLALLPVIGSAQAGELVVGGQTVAYNSATTSESGTLYYMGEEMVASEHDEVTLIYKNGELVLEAHDTDGDGELDAFVSLDANGEITEVSGEGADAFLVPEITEFTDLLANEGDVALGQEDDLVGSLDSITVPKYHNYLLYALLLVLAGGGYWYWKKR